MLQLQHAATLTASGMQYPCRPQARSCCNLLHLACDTLLLPSPYPYLLPLVFGVLALNAVCTTIHSIAPRCAQFHAAPGALPDCMHAHIYITRMSARVVRVRIQLRALRALLNCIIVCVRTGVCVHERVGCMHPTSCCPWREQQSDQPHLFFLHACTPAGARRIDERTRPCKAGADICTDA